MPLRKEEKLLSNKRTEKSSSKIIIGYFFVFKLFLLIELHFTSLSNFGLKTSKAKGKKNQDFPSRLFRRWSWKSSRDEFEALGWKLAT